GAAKTGAQRGEEQGLAQPEQHGGGRGRRGDAGGTSGGADGKYQRAGNGMGIGRADPPIEDMGARRQGFGQRDGEAVAGGDGGKRATARIGRDQRQDQRTDRLVEVQTHGIG